MKLLFYISTLRGGGAARVMTNLANQFSRDGNKVIIATNLKEASAYHLDNNVRVIHIDDSDSVRRNYLSRNYYRCFRLRSIIKTECPDSVISFMTENNVRCLLSCINMDVKVFTSVRSDPHHECGEGLKGLIIKKIYELSDGVICQTEDALKWFTKKTQSKGAVILNQIDDEYYEKEKSTPQKDCIISAGRFVEAKNHKLLIEAFSDIANDIDDNLIIYGDGELRDNYEHLISDLGLEDRILLPGNSEDMITCYDEAKLFILSSDYEGLPNVLMEAMAREVPCVSTDCPCGGPKLLFDNGKYGDLVPVNNRSALAKSILKLISNDNLREEYITKLKKRKLDFRSEKVFLQWKEFIK